MKAEEVVQHIDGVDRRLNRLKKVPDEEKVLNLTATYRRYGWAADGVAKPLSDDACKQLRLEDKSGDGRWSGYFRQSSRDLAIYRSHIGFYWVLYFDNALSEHFLQHVGSAADVEARFGAK